MPAPERAGTCWVGFAAVVAVALALVPAGAHLFEMPHKLALSPDAYMTVQEIYRGWALFGIVIVAALALTLAHAWLTRASAAASELSLISWLLIAATQVVFWTFTYPENAATRNWTRMPVDFESARRLWEHSHALNAGLTFLALLAMLAAALAAPRPGPPS